MSTNFFYYRCPCPSTECNGAICRYQDIMPGPVPNQYAAPSCARFTPERKLLSYQTTPKELQGTAGKYDSISPPMTITRDNFRWTPYPAQTRISQERPVTVKTSPERSKLPMKHFLNNFEVITKWWNSCPSAFCALVLFWSQWITSHFSIKVLQIYRNGLELSPTL